MHLRPQLVPSAWTITELAITTAVAGLPEVEPWRLGVASAFDGVAAKNRTGSTRVEAGRAALPENRVGIVRVNPRQTWPTS